MQFCSKLYVKVKQTLQRTEGYKCLVGPGYIGAMLIHKQDLHWN